MLDSSSTRQDADDLFADCTRERTCTDEKQKEINSIDADADDIRTRGVVSLVIGGVGLVSGVTFLLVDSGQSSTASTQVRPVVGLGYAGVAGRF